MWHHCAHNHRHKQPSNNHKCCKLLAIGRESVRKDADSCQQPAKKDIGNEDHPALLCELGVCDSIHSDEDVGADLEHGGGSYEPGEEVPVACEVPYGFAVAWTASYRCPVVDCWWSVV